MGRWTYRATVITLCTLAFFATMVARLVISPVLPEIEAEFGVSSAITGLALTGMWMAYSLSQFPSGVLADRYGERRVILAAVGLTAVASGLLALSPSIHVFVLLTVCLGGVAGLHYSVATTLLTKEFENIGSAIGIHNSGAPLAGLLAPIAAAAVAGWVGWRYSIALGAVCAAPIALVFAWKVRDTEPARPNQPMGERIALGPVIELLTRPQIAFTALVAICFEFVWQATASFLPTFLVAHHGYSIGMASALFSAYFVIHGLTQPAVGSLSDRFGRDRTATVCAVLGIAGYGLLVLGSGLLAIALAIGLVGTAMSWGAAVLPRFMDHLSPEERGAGFGLVRTSYMLVSATGSAVVGTVADFASWGIAFSVFLLLLSAVACALVANRTLDLGL
ncbi:MFS transporter [Halalkalicoccus jeotgali]|uniref:Major facilitator superfamily MFS_1 n=1 Tax=Halalkalicoccus jeotgali (strain DSM 18796 / CECT 7217 / JCM 14584 / KCTC 4019 / B3) TaxID=795797 RepID=D8J9Q1_HALJB|nr:MFS transporter [Halalkalicoccus jeotgali]ADJ16390.1 major facilitator superfamily MFS_1 [Halalkalicoccus jeotgali B3]ELY37124.1 major facilitator superfamily protein [Halalkalicoccus jeotgali B3]